MKSRQFPSFEAAKEYLASKGELQFFGREGHDAEYGVFTLTVGVKMYDVRLYMNGKMEIGERK